MTELFNFKIRIKNLNIPKTVWVEKAPNRRVIYDKYIKWMDAKGFKYMKTETKNLTEAAMIFHPKAMYSDSKSLRMPSGRSRITVFRSSLGNRLRTRVRRDRDYDVYINVKKL